MVSEPEVDLTLAIKHGLSEEEYDQIISTLRRTPTYTELGIYSVMWSEHCSYKNSLALIRTLPTHSPKLLAQPGEENAGLLDIGDGLAVVFKIESHNHPSAVEPYQGAATGVGGILRDVFTMGARPVAMLNSLRFGDLDTPRTRYLLSQVVKGIGDYGNSFGVPTVGGEVYFDHSYNHNPLVNAMAVGLVSKEKVIRATAKGVGNPVLIVGSATGRDGIHGATFASEEISDRSADRRPSVQVGDPFTEKCLLEALLEAAEFNCLIGVQDMGAAGIACSTSEMSARGGCGMEINLDLVPVRESDMSPYESVLSESQERMLVVARPDKVEELKSIFSKWDIKAVEIGKVVSDPTVRFSKGGKVCAEIPSGSLVAGFGAPVYSRESRLPAYLEATRKFSQEELPVLESIEDTLLKLLASPNIASKAWVYHQYDAAVQTNTVMLPGADAAVIRLKGSSKLLAMTTDGNSRYAYLSPRRGGSIAVAEAARNIVCVGATPLAVTNCLNFGNPYDPEVYWQFAEAVKGIADACVALSTPVTGGNVSFYNEGPDGPVLPTPVIGMIGIIDNEDFVVTPSFKDDGDLILLLGQTRGHVGGTELLSSIYGITAGEAPPIDLEFEVLMQRALLRLTMQRLIKSAHDLSEGGLAVALAESCIHDKLAPRGARISFITDKRPDFLLFGEDQSRIVITVAPSSLRPCEILLSSFNVPYQVLGEVEGRSLEILHCVTLPIAQLQEVYEHSLHTHMLEPLSTEPE